MELAYRTLACRLTLPSLVFLAACHASSDVSDVSIIGHNGFLVPDDVQTLTYRELQFFQDVSSNFTDSLVDITFATDADIQKFCDIDYSDGSHGGCNIRQNGVNHIYIDAGVLSQPIAYLSILDHELAHSFPSNQDVSEYTDILFNPDGTLKSGVSDDDVINSYALTNEQEMWAVGVTSYRNGAWFSHVGLRLDQQYDYLRDQVFSGWQSIHADSDSDLGFTDLGTVEIPFDTYYPYSSDFFVDEQDNLSLLQALPDTIQISRLDTQNMTWSAVRSITPSVPENSTLTYYSINYPYAFYAVHPDDANGAGLLWINVETGATQNLKGTWSLPYVAGVINDLAVVYDGNGPSNEIGVYDLQSQMPDQSAHYTEIFGSWANASLSSTSLQVNTANYFFDASGGVWQWQTDASGLQFLFSTRGAFPDAVLGQTVFSFESRASYSGLMAFDLQTQSATLFTASALQNEGQLIGIDGFLYRFSLQEDQQAYSYAVSRMEP